MRHGGDEARVRRAVAQLPGAGPVVTSCKVSSQCQKESLCARACSFFQRDPRSERPQWTYTRTTVRRVYGRRINRAGRSRQPYHRLHTRRQGTSPPVPLPPQRAGPRAPCNRRRNSRPRARRQHAWNPLACRCAGIRAMSACAAHARRCRAGPCTEPCQQHMHYHHLAQWVPEESRFTTRLLVSNPRGRGAH